MSLLLTIKAGRQNYIDRTFPGTDVTVRIRVLSNQDMLDASMATDRLFKESGIEVNFQNVKMYEAEKDVQHLYRACIDLDGKPLAASITEFRKNLSVAEKAWLIEQYNDLDEQCNPSPETLSDEEFDALVQAAKKNPDRIGSVSSISTLRRLVCFLASPQSSLLKDSGPTSQ